MLSISARLLVSVLAMVIAFLGGMALITHARPYDDGGLRDLLMPSGCEMPCFLGIRPGVTTRDEVIAILESHEWIGVVHDDESGSIIRAYWSPTMQSKPASSANNGVVAVTAPYWQETIGLVRLHNSPFRLGELLLSLGAEYKAYYELDTRSSGKFYWMRLHYPLSNLLISLDAYCNRKLRLPFMTEMFIIGDDVSFAESSRLRGRNSRDDAFRVITDWCRHG